MVYRVYSPYSLIGVIINKVDIFFDHNLINIYALLENRISSAKPASQSRIDVIVSKLYIIIAQLFYFTSIFYKFSKILIFLIIYINGEY
jgi:hypothetical protein